VTLRPPSWRLAVALSAALGAPAQGRTLTVGPGQEYKLPSEAAKAAAAGDSIEIQPQDGGYYDCAIWRAANLTIEGVGDGVVITDTTCQGKALFVTVGNGITIRNLTFQRARVPDGNGAGIRAQGANLRVEKSRFIDNQAGLLAAPSPGSKMAILDTEFADNGHCAGPRCAAALAVSELAELHVEHCVFEGTRQGDDVASGAARTEIVDTEMTQGPAGTGRDFVLLTNGGSLVMRNDALEKGPHSSDTDYAVNIRAGFDAQPVAELTFAGNRFTNDTGHAVVFLHNLSSGNPTFDNNRFDPATSPVSTSGYGWFWTKSLAHATVDSLKRGLRSVRRTW
jgi:hypothetical protein